MKIPLNIFVMSDASICTSVNCSSPPMMPESVSNLEFKLKIAMKTTWATNEYPHLGFVPLFPRLSGMFSCLHDVNPPSSKYPFSSIRRGDRYGGDPQLLQDWNILEGKLLAMTIAFRVSPIPGPMLFELRYPLPSSFGYTRLHRYWGVADAILEHSRNAFCPLMATVSYFLFMRYISSYQERSGMDCMGPKTYASF